MTAMVVAGSSMMLLPLVAPLRDAGVNLADFWCSVGVDATDLGRPQARLDNALLLRAWDEAVRLTGDENLGLKAAERYEPGMFHVLDFLVANAATLDDAIEKGRTRLRLLHDLARLTREDREDGTTLRLESAAGGLMPRAQADFFLSCLVRVGRMLTGVDDGPAVVYLHHSAPSDLTLARRTFRCELVYGADADALELAPWQISRACLRADPALLRVVGEHADLLLEQLPNEDPLLVRVRGRIAEYLRTDASLQTVARSMGMSPRTLRRRLLDHQTSFHALREDLRIDMARRLLRDPRLSVDQVAGSVGFGSAQSFSRSFRRAVGESPTHFRRGTAAGE